MNTKQEEFQNSIGFEFETISISEAKTLVVKSSNKYATLIDQVLSELAKRGPDETLKFGHSNGAQPLAEKQKDGILTALNKTFREKKMPWHVVWSKKGSCFVIDPYLKVRKTYSLKTNGAVKVGTQESLANLHILKKAAVEAFGPAALSGANKEYRRAIVYVGRNRLNVRNTDLMDLFKMASSSVANAAQIGADSVPDEIARLEAVLNKN